MNDFDPEEDRARRQRAMYEDDDDDHGHGHGPGVNCATQWGRPRPRGGGDPVSERRPTLGKYCKISSAGLLCQSDWLLHPLIIFPPCTWVAFSLLGVEESTTNCPTQLIKSSSGKFFLSNHDKFAKIKRDFTSNLRVPLNLFSQNQVEMFAVLVCNISAQGWRSSLAWES